MASGMVPVQPGEVKYILMDLKSAPCNIVSLHMHINLAGANTDGQRLGQMIERRETRDNGADERAKREGRLPNHSIAIMSLTNIQ